jgi:hypothetical protein
MVDGAESVGDPVLTAMPDQQHWRVPERAATSGALALRLEPGGLESFAQRTAGLPVRSSDRPGNDVLEPAEDGAAVARTIAEAEPVALLHRVAAPRASLPTFVCCVRACPSR